MTATPIPAGVRPDPALRGKCKEMAEAAAAANPSLTVVRGWYDDPHWGEQEHWWCKTADGAIVDPTAAQFPLGGVADWYREFEGFYPCAECGEETAEDNLVGGVCCSGTCYGRMVGVPL